MANKMLIDATHPEETRVVVLRGNRVEEFDFETAHRKQLRGNIYLAKVTRVEPSLQAAFVDYGGNRHGFLAFSEIHPDYYQIPMADRQALIEEDERAQRDEDDDSNGHGHGRRNGRHRRHESRAHARSDDAVHGDASAEEAAGGLSDRAGDHGPDDTHRADTPASDIPIEAAPPAPQAFEAAHPPVGETANPPVAAEIAAEPPPAPEYRTEAADPAHAAAADEYRPPNDEDRSHAATPEHGGNGNGHGNGHTQVDEEEEIVESAGGADAMEEVPTRAPRYRRQYKIQEVIKRRQVMLVQVVKEERGTKGAALTTYLSLAGRYCVLMPNTARGGGISRKITSAEDRKKLREIAEELEVPEGMGVILRTAGAARTKAEVGRDFEYLLRQWELVRDLTLRSTAPTLVYEEGSLVKRSIRDLYSKDIDEIVVAGEASYKDAKEFMRMLMPSHAKNVKPYHDTQPLLTRYGCESQLDAMFSPTVQLRSGGYVVINQTEALVAIDVNSGRSTREHHIEDTALKTNLEASDEIARQLRLRDLAGLIVIDFIDMDEKHNNRTVERRLKDALRNDRARIQVGRISHFGLMEMSRQRIRTSVLESSTEKCPHCGGTGHVRSVSSVSLQLLRSLEETLLKGPTHNQIVRTKPEIALYVLNHKRAHLRALEERFHIAITVNSDPEVGGLVGFTIDRGEQVMTMEQAKALLAQSDAAPVPHPEEEPELMADDMADAEAADAEAAEPDGETRPGMPGEGDHDSENGREGGRGRRRRRGRGRNGEDREPFQPREQAASFEPGAPVHEAEGLAQPVGDQPIPEGAPDEQGMGQPHPYPENGEANGNGARRRRRGRRGGRRNRRDRDGQGDFAPATGETHAQDWQENPDQAERPQPHEQLRSDFAPPPAPIHAEPPRAEPPAPMMSAPAAPPAVAQPEPAAEPPRRRSTVREPAPVFGQSAPVAMPAPVPQPAPLPLVQAEAETADKPRRTGWWAKRLLGGSKD